MPVRDRGVIVLACGVGPAPRLARALAALGRTVALISDTPAEPAPGLHPHVCRFESAQAVHQAMEHAVEQIGGLREVVISVLPRSALGAVEVNAMRAADWQNVHTAFKPALYGLQAVSRLASGACAVTLLGPNISMIGAAGLVPLCTAVEAQRALVKSAARQLGARGIRINWVGVGSTEFDRAFEGIALPAVPELGPPPPALGRRIDIEADVLPAVEFLCSPAAGGLTGHTMNIDGGDWMLP